MVAWAGIERLRFGWADDLDTNARPRWPLDGLLAHSCPLMNYRHAFHAGNFADCFKHALLVALIDALRRKSTPFFVLDTHAGVGRYDLNAAPAQRSGEARKGIHRLLQSRSAALLRYLRLTEELGLYPGSPLLIRALLRDGDRLACCELHPADAMSLRNEFSRDPQVAVHERSGWEAVGALLPPKERRGLVFIDPPFENADEFSGARKWPVAGTSAVYAWHICRVVPDQTAFLRSKLPRNHERGLNSKYSCC